MSYIKAMPSECCVPLCTNRGGHLFPWHDPGRVKAWTITIKRATPDCRSIWKPSKYSVVCRSHFDDGDYKTSTYYGTFVLTMHIYLFLLHHAYILLHC